MRYHVKGGIWKNTEDEILKAAVMKYGLNQWSRISSLLVRKSAKQCKERWYEWLDPQIKKTEWTKDEEEKLLHLAKMFPCQWRTIAPKVGRTAYQCLEHYEILLDRAQGRETDENDPRKLKPGEIDPNPETKPARPDPIDMEEDQKEMLNEARARLANTRGKKAKRKAREKQLEEARRLAALQKKRELKSAGIEVVLRLPRKKKKEMNYNVDVPFLRKVPEGSFKIDTEVTPVVNKFKGAISLQVLENKNRDLEEEKYKKIDEKRMKNLKQKDLPEAIERINKMNDPMNIMQRNKLNLPEPQVTDRELEGISKLTSTGMIGSVDRGEMGGNSSATKVLMGEYTQPRGMTPNSMLRTPKAEDQIMKEAKMAISLREGQTPLIGGESANEDLQNYLNYKKTEIVNKNTNFKTPAPLGGNINNTNNNIFNNNSSTNLNSTVLTKKMTDSNSRTPLRDEMKINLNEHDQSYAWENSSLANSSISKQHEQITIKSILSNLPKPQNKYEIDFSDNRENLLKEIEEGEKTKIPEDSEDRANRLFLEKREKEKIEFLNQSQVIQRNFPRPNEINYKYQSYSEIMMSLSDEGVEEERIKAENLIREEMLRLVEVDAVNHPVKGSKISNLKNIDDMDVEEYSLDEKQSASELIKQEMQNFNKENTDLISSNDIWDKTYKNEVYYIPDVQMYFHVNDMEKSKKYESLQENFNIQKSILSKEENFSRKLEEKAGVLTNGYLKRLGGLGKKYDDLVSTILDLKSKINIYTELKLQEDNAILNRVKNIDENIERMKQRENELQSMYKKYKEKIEELENL